jgi:type I restriction enzyme S subunit
MNKVLKPQLRFKGFTDPWEQRKFSEITFPAGEKNKNNLELESYSITNADGFIPQNVKFENGGTMREANKSMYYIVSPNSFAYNPARINIGSIGYQNFDRNVIVSSLYEVFKTTNEINDIFLWYWFRSNNFKRLIEQLQEGGVRLYFYYDKLCMGSIYTPTIKEQCKIGVLLENIDNLITLHQRKYEKLINIKKSMLEKMFPENGNSIPEIRFKGFTAPWEQCKLELLCDKFKDGDWIESKDQDKSGIRLIQTGNIGVTEFINKIANMKWISEDTFQRLGCFEVLPGDLLISRLPDPAGRACIVPNLGIKMVTAVDCTIVRTVNKCNKKFLVQYLSSSKYFNEVNTSLAGGTRQRISRKNLGKFLIPIPKNINEQNKIGMFLQNIDNIITLHQRKLEKLKNIKKSCLEKMFI